MGTCPVHGHRVLHDDAYFTDPLAVYAALHHEGPIHRICFPDTTPAWLVTRYSDVRDALRDPRLGRPRSYAGPDFAMAQYPEGADRGILIMEDPPEHTRSRRFVNFAFLPRRVEAMRAGIQAVVDGLLDDIEERGEADLVTDFAAPLPVAVIGELLGVSADDRDSFYGWAHQLFGEDPQRSVAAFKEIDSYVGALVERRRAEPQDDLISYWTVAEDGHGGGRLTDQEMVSLSIVVLVAGYAPTFGTIAASIRDLLEHPDALAALRADPGLYPVAVEELIRRNSGSKRAFRRFATEDLEIGGARIAKGDTVMIGLSASGRDPDHFPEPERLDFGRDRLDHVAFGMGPHFCPGSELARLEIRLALESLVTRFPDLRLAVDPGELRWLRSHAVHSLCSLPVRL